MARFTIKIDGVEIPVQGVSSEKEARAAVVSAIKENPEFLDDQRTKFREAVSGNAGSRFLIGAGNTLQGAALLGRSVANAVTGDTVQATQLLRQFEREEASFNRLDESGIGAEDIGEFAPELAGAAVSIGQAVARSGIGKLMQLTTGVTEGGVGNYVKALAGSKLLQKLPFKKIVQGVSESQDAKAVANVVSKIDNPELAAKTLDGLGERVIQKQQEVRDAQVKIAQDFRKQEAEATAGAVNQAGQESAEAIKQALLNAGQTEDQAAALLQKVADRSALREQIKQANVRN